MSATKRKTIRNQKECWEVDFGKVRGVRVRKFFPSEAEANSAIAKAEKDLKRQGDAWFSLPVENRNTVLFYHAEIKKSGHTIKEVWEGFLDWKKAKAENPDLVSVSFIEAVKNHAASKLGAGKDARYVEETSKLLLKFAAGKTERLISEFTHTELDDWIKIQAWGLCTKKSNMGRFSSLWAYALKQRWVLENIVDRLEAVGKIPVTPEKFNNETCLRLLAWSLANDNHKRVLAPLVLGLFTGMRPEEITHPKFGWHSIDLKRGQITIPGEIAKDGDRRYTQLLPTAILWLELALKLKNPLPPVNERKLLDSICECAGVTQWPHDVLRKTAATHLYSHYRDAGKVVMELGNSIRILLKHYIAMANDEESKEFWGFTPQIAQIELDKLRADLAQPQPTASEIAKTAG